jgi:hypothetical protein
MQARHLKSFAVLLAALCLVACDQGRKALEKTRVYVVNVAPDFAALGFQREQPPGASPDTLPFKGATKYDYDVDTYDFFVYQRQLTTQTLPHWEFSKAVAADKNYAFVLAESGGQVTPQIVEYAPKATTATDTQVAAVHAAENLPPMDIYIEKAGAGIAGATPKGSLAFLAQLKPASLATGDYEIFLTAAGNPANVLFASPVVNLAAAVTNVFVIAAEKGLGNAPLSVVMVQDNPATLYSTTVASGLRVINSAADGQARDFAFNHEYSPPAIPAVPFATASTYAPTPVASTLPITVTPAGNPGVLEVDSTITTLAGDLYTVLVGGVPGALTYQIVVDDNRRILNEAKVRYLNGASQFTTATELVLLPPNTADQTTVGAVSGFAAVAASDYLYVIPGTYDLLLREISTNTVRAGPIPVTFAASGIYSILVVNGPDANTASVVFLDDHP